MSNQQPNAFLQVARQGAREHWYAFQFSMALRERLPDRYREGRVFYTEADLDHMFDAICTITDPKTPYEEGYGVEMVCAPIPQIWELLHGQLAMAWMIRAQNGRADGYELCQLHRRAESGERVTLSQVWDLCPWKGQLKG